MNTDTDTRRCTIAAPLVERACCLLTRGFEVARGSGGSEPGSLSVKPKRRFRSSSTGASRPTPLVLRGTSSKRASVAAKCTTLSFALPQRYPTGA